MDASIPASIRCWADSSSYLDGLQRITNGHGVDMVVEMLANMNLDATEGAGSPQANVVVGSRGSWASPLRLTMVTGASILGRTPVERHPRREPRRLCSVCQEVCRSSWLSARSFRSAELPTATAAYLRPGIRNDGATAPIDPVHGTEYRNHLSQSAMGSLVRA